MDSHQSVSVDQKLQKLKLSSSPEEQTSISRTPSNTSLNTPSEDSSSKSDYEFAPEYTVEQEQHQDPNDLPAKDAEEIDESLRWIPLPPSPSRIGQYPPLTTPICVPQIEVSKGFGAMPYLRAYSPELAKRDITAEDFMAFIDHLAVAMIAPAPFQVMKMGAMAVGFVPNPIAMFVSMGVGIANGVGSAVYVIARTKRYMARVNKDFLNPRGLKVTIKRDEDLCHLLGIVGPRKRDLDAKTLNHDVTDMVPLRERRMDAMSPYIAPLTEEVPPPTVEHNVFDKFGAYQIQKTITKQERRDFKQANKAIRKSEKHDRKADKRASKYARKEMKHAKKEMKHARKHGYTYGNEYEHSMYRNQQHPTGPPSYEEVSRYSPADNMPDEQFVPESNAMGSHNDFAEYPQGYGNDQFHGRYPSQNVAGLRKAMKPRSKTQEKEMKRLLKWKWLVIENYDPSKEEVNTERR